MRLNFLKFLKTGVIACFTFSTSPAIAETEIGPAFVECNEMNYDYMQALQGSWTIHHGAGVAVGRDGRAMAGVPFGAPESITLSLEIGEDGLFYMRGQGQSMLMIPAERELVQNIFIDISDVGGSVPGPVETNCQTTELPTLIGSTSYTLGGREVTEHTLSLIHI